MRLRLLEAPAGGWISPATAFARLYADDPLAVFLDCGVDATAGVSVIAAGSRLVTANVAAGTVTVDGVTRSGTIFDFLREHSELAPPEGPQPGPGFGLGWVGWLGYGLGAQTLGVPSLAGGDHPDAALIFVDRAVTFDHATGVVSLLALGQSWSGDRAGWRAEVIARLAEPSTVLLEGEAAANPHPVPGAVIEWRYSDATYLEMIRECQRRIYAGDAYQLCLTNEARVRQPPAAAFDTYLRLRASSPTHHGFFFRAAGAAILSASPETFLVVSPSGVVESKPIKGTAPRGLTEAHDHALREQLVQSDKERAENLMIVDLVRNDLAKVSEIGSVSVPSLLAIETYAQVHQLVSTVRGQLKKGLSAVDAVEACFPAGSMTGAPKASAVSILAALEGRARGIYSGAFGYFGLDGRADLAMVIRTIVVDAHGATIGSGGGITALSVPEDELAEVKLKAAVLLSVLCLNQ